MRAARVPAEQGLPYVVVLGAKVEQDGLSTSLLKRLERVERRLGLRSQINKETRKPAADTDATDLISQAEACRYIGCGKSTIKRWADRGLVTGYLKGKRVYYSRRELDRSEVVKEHRTTDKEKEDCHGTDRRDLAE